jgi:hypothetical protein
LGRLCSGGPKLSCTGVEEMFVQTVELRTAEVDNGCWVPAQIQVTILAYNGYCPLFSNASQLVLDTEGVQLMFFKKV